MLQHGMIYINGGFRPAIAKQGSVWTRVVFQDGSRVIVRRTRDNKLRVSPIHAYPMRKLATRMLRRKNCMGVSRHITKGAKAILVEAKGATS